MSTGIPVPTKAEARMGDVSSWWCGGEGDNWRVMMMTDGDGDSGEIVVDRGTVVLS